MKRHLLLALLFVLSCTSKPIKRSISSLSERLSLNEEEQIISKAYECLNKVEYLSSDEFKFEEKDENAVREAFAVCLSEYIKIKTISPEGNEERAVVYWSTIFENLNIPYKIYKTPPMGNSNKERYNLIATIPADGSSDYDWSRKNNKKSMIITHHMDVVDVISSQWISPELTFSGEVKEYKGREYVWGRGAFDMKGIGIVQFLSMYIFRNTIEQKNMDLHFLALADEEENGSGAIGTLRLMAPGKELHALTNATILLNEGGGSVADVPVEGKDLVAISTEQKGGAWLRVSKKDPLKLFKSLNKLGLLRFDRKRERKNRVDEKYKCTVVQIDGPEPKVNVVTSRMKMVLNCNKDNHFSYGVHHLKAYDEIIQAIKKDHKDVKFDIKLENKNVIVNVDTQSSSHGSVGLSKSAVDIMAISLFRLRIINLSEPRNPRIFKYKRTKSTKEFIKNLSKYNKKLKLFNKFSFIPFVRNQILAEIEDQFDIDGLFKTKCLLTNFIYKTKEASAYVDCRLLHTTFKYKNNENHAEKFIKYLIRKKFLEFDLKVEKISGWNFTSSPIDTREFETLISTISTNYKDSVVTPYLNPAGSDSAWFRNPYVLGIKDVKPVNSYGVFPAKFTAELLSGLHGSNERFPTDQARPSIEIYYKILKSLNELYKDEK